MNLEELLEQAATNVDKRLEFMNALMNSEVFMIGSKTLKKDDEGKEVPNFSLFTIKNKEEKDVVPFFTSTEKLNEFAVKIAQGQPPTITIKAVSLFQLVAANNLGAIINLNSQFSKEFIADEVKAIVKSLTMTKTPADIDPKNNVIITLPKESPKELISILTKFFSSRLDIISAFVFEITFPNQKPHFLFVIDSEFELPELLDKIKEKIKDFYNDSDQLFDVISAKERICQGFIKGQIPFYSKRYIIK